jgi:hypothetical protein
MKICFFTADLNSELPSRFRELGHQVHLISTNAQEAKATNWTDFRGTWANSVHSDINMYVLRHGDKHDERSLQWLSHRPGILVIDGLSEPKWIYGLATAIVCAKGEHIPVLCELCPGPVTHLNPHTPGYAQRLLRLAEEALMIQPILNATNHFVGELQKWTKNTELQSMPSIIEPLDIFSQAARNIDANAQN